ncbi:MAG TPA: hypothetical protein VIS48_07085 [Candidatus Kryptonia bacterium]
MKTLLALLTGLSISFEGVAQSLPANDIIARSEVLTQKSDKKSWNLNGTLKTSMNLASSVIGRHSSGSAVYRITVTDGMDSRNELIEKSDDKDSSFTKFLARESERRLDKPAFRTFESAYPWERYLARANEKKTFTAEIVSDTSMMAGKRCYEIHFELDAEGDSLSAEGEGIIWIDAATLFPVRTYHDFSVSGTRGIAEVRSFSDFAELQGGIPVLVRSEIQTMPKFLFLKIGTIKIVIEQTDFNLE